MTDGPGQGAECIVVGGGLAGLACAQSLSADGYTVQLVEADSRLGGRASGGLHLGEPYDDGFHVIPAAFPDTADFLEDIGVDGDDLRTFQRSVVLHDGDRWRRLRLLGAGSILTSRLMPRRDGIRLTSLAARLAISGGAAPSDDDAGLSTEAWLHGTGLSERTIENVMRPFLGAVLMDRSLSADAAFARFVLGALARGPAMLPVDGMSMLADRAADAISAAGGMIWTGVTVEAIEIGETGRATGVRLADGRRINAQSVVVAVDPSTARRLLDPIDPDTADAFPTEFLGSVSATFALSDPLYRDATVLVDAASPEGENRVDLMCQVSNVTRPGSPGPYIVTAQSATTGWSGVDPDSYTEAVGHHVRSTVPGFAWERAAELIAVTVTPHAQYRIPPGRRATLPGPMTAVANVVVAGDATTHPSIEGAISSGYRAAEIVAGLHP